MLLHLVLLQVCTVTVLSQNHYGGYDNGQLYASGYPQQYNQGQMFPPPQQQQQYYNPSQQSPPMTQMYQPMPPTGQQYQQPQQYQPSGRPYGTMVPPTSKPYQPVPNQQSQSSGYEWPSTTGPSSSTAATQQQSGVQRDDQPKDCAAPRQRGDFCSTAQQRQMFYYDSATKLCQPFMYNGCNGNGNRFETAAECKNLCVNGNGATQPQRDDTASLHQAMQAACQGEYAVAHLTPQQCGGNDQQCPTGYQCTSEFCCPTPDYLCNLRYDSGKFAVGGEKSDHYFYTSEYRTCMRFSFYGSLGNENNFADYNSCMRTCGSQQ